MPCQRGSSYPTNQRDSDRITQFTTEIHLTLTFIFSTEQTRHFQPHKSLSFLLKPHPLRLRFHFHTQEGDEEEEGEAIPRPEMAAVSSTAVAIPSFTGLKAAAKPAAVAARIPSPSNAAPRIAVRASLRDAVGAAAVATFASAALFAGNASAITVLLGSSDGGLVFEPSEFSISAGEKIEFKNNAAFPHNVVFDEDEVPSGVDVGKISMDETDLLNGPGEVYSVTLTEKGTYSFYCSPHQGVGMTGKVTVN